MTTLLNRSAADSLLSVLDLHVRAAGKTLAKADAEPDADTEAEQADDTGEDDDVSQPLPGAEDAPGADIPTDPDELKAWILTQVQEELDWDGQSGDPNASKDAFEDALADMFDRDVEIVWNGEDALILRVEGQEPVPLTPAFLGELLAELAKQGAAAPDDGEAEPEPDERGHEVVWRRSGVIDEHKHLHAPKGVGGGRFVSKGGGVGGAVKKAANAVGNAPAKAPGKTGPGRPGGGKGGSSPSALARLANSRGGRRTVAKAVSAAFSAGFGKRVRVLFDDEGYLAVGPGKPKMTPEQTSAALFATWLAFGIPAGILSVLGAPVVSTGASAVATTAILTRLFKNRKARKKAKAAAQAAG